MPREGRSGELVCLGGPFERSLKLMDSRRGVRYPVELECRLSVLVAPAATVPGKTVNMSRCGVLVWFHQPMPSPAMPGPGDLARILLELPHAPSLRGRCLDCLCRVVRVDIQADACLVAFDVKRHYFRPAPQGAPADSRSSSRAASERPGADRAGRLDAPALRSRTGSRPRGG